MKRFIALLLLTDVTYALATLTTTQVAISDTLNNVPTDTESVTNNLLNPMLTDTEQLSTPDGTMFNTALMCKSSNTFLEILAQPGNTGDINFLQLSRDTNLNGTIDSVKNFSKPISGVCANGLISCDAGTWNNCLGYKYQFDNNNLSFAETGIGGLGGCYCINSSCGDNSRSMRMLPSIIKDIGSSIAQVMANANPEYTISNAIVNGATAKFYGQKLSDCKNGNISNLASYKDHVQSLEQDAESAKNNEDSAYYQISSSHLTSKNLTTSRACNIVRNTTYTSTKLEDIITFNGGTGGVHRCATDGCLELVLGRIGDNYWGGWCSVKHQSVSFFINKPHKIKSANLVRAKWDDWIRITVNNDKIYAYPYPDWDGYSTAGKNCEWSTSWNKNPNVDFTDKLQVRGRVDFQIDVQVAGAGEGYAYAQVFVDESCDLDQEWISNSCETIHSDNNCKLKSEWIDGVNTYSNFNPTGKSPISVTKDIGGCGLEVTRSWWNVEREYECRVNQELDFSKGIRRNAVVQETLTTNDYDDLIFGTTTKKNINVPNMRPSSCTNACKTKRIKQKGSTVTTEGVKSESGTEYEVLYRKCTGGTQNICPNESNETVITQCSCLNEFGVASSLMQATRLAAQDLICTTGDPQSF